ncbi:DUF2092 domain-containing protein [Streptomyces sp. ODS28]|uniref:LolA family protein n=1 Tax=Streptomyces sp. ODS28 TaxID=3136688 RepID=UPI0031E8219F
MAQIQPKQPGGPEDSHDTHRSKAARYGVPVAVAGIAAATIGIVPAIASAGSPDLPHITAEQLVAKMAKSHVQHLSGTVKTTTDLGLPGLPGGGSAGGAGQQGGGPFAGGPHGEGGGKGGSADPQQKLMELASGTHTLRVAADGPDRQRVSLVEEAAEYSFIHNGKDVWAYDSGSDSAYHAKGEAQQKGGAQGKGEDSPKDRHGTIRGSDGEGLGTGKGLGSGKGLENATPQQAAQQALKAVQDTTSVSVDGTQTVAGRDAYQLVITPKGKGAADSTVQSIRIAVDGKTGVPLKFTLNPKGGGKPVIDTAFTSVDFGKPAAKTFDFTPPKGTKVTEAKPGQQRPGGGAEFGLPGAGPEAAPGKPDARADGKNGMRHGMKNGAKNGVKTFGEGWGTVAQIQGPKGGLGGAGGAAPKPAPGSGGSGGDAQGQRMLDSMTKEVKGEFGTGRVFSTRLVNALITDDGKVYVGAVTKDALVKAADSAAK